MKKEKMSLEIHQKFLFLLLLVKGFNCLYDEGPSFTEEPPSRVEFINDLGIRLNCSAKGRPIPSIRWSSSDGASLVPEVPGLRYFSSSDGSLVFPGFSPDNFRPDVHSSTYRCIASNSVGTVVSRDVQLRAVVKEQFEARVESQRGKRGFPTVLECVINPKYMRDYVILTSWVRDESYNILPGSLDSDNKYHILSDGSLLIWQLGSQDSLFTYQCRCLHRLTGQTIVSSPGKVSIDDIEGPTRPDIRYRTSSVIVKENERVILPCIATGLPKPSFRWFKKEGNRLISVIDETSLEEVRSWDSHQGSRESQSASTTNALSSSGLMRIRHGALIITSVKVAHKGMYLCNASNSEGSDFLEMELVVRSSLTVNIHPEKLTVDLGKNAEFTCSASGEPPPSSISWMKDGTILRSGSSAGRVRFLSQSRIIVSGVVREDQGIYQCVVKNDYETGQQAAQLRLGDSYPQFIYRFIEQTLQPGPAISLKCSSTGNPTPKVQWMLDGWPLPKSDRFLIGQYANVYGDVISHVNITSVRVEDGGEYECSFENRAGKTTHAARLNIYGPPYVRPMPDILATAGQKLTIKCPVGGYPLDKAAIVWERDGLKLPLSDRQSVSFNGTQIISIEPVERSDSGTYFCLAENKQGSNSQRSVNVRVMVPPKITPFTLPTDLHEGERINIQCVVVKGDLPLTITWLKDQSLLSPMNINHGHGHQAHVHNKNILHNKMVHGGGEPKVSMRQLDDFSSVLSISSLESGHSGNYTCQAKNNAATAIHTSVLLVNVRPRISPFSFDDGLTEGMRTQVMCNTIAGDEPINMTWLKNTREVHREDVGIQVNYFSTFSTILSIPNITSSHSGNYSCIVSNQVGQVVHTAQLIVTVPAKWILQPKDQSVSVGSHVSIHCQSEGYPKPTIKWKQAVGGPDKKEFREVGYRTPGVLAAENGTLIISRVTEDHEAHYLCLANNGVGPGLSKLIRLTVNAAPRIRSRPQKEMVRRGETVRLRCEAEGDEPIMISWVAKGISLNDTKNSRFSTIRHPGSGSGSPSVSELTIREVSLDDRGDFECIAINAFGQDSFRISLLVQERPQVPKNFRLVEHTSRTVVLSWSLPSSEQDANVLDYIIWFKQGMENWSEQTNKKSTSGDQSSLIVSGLSPANTYEFRLYARNQLGMSDPTELLQVTTEGEAPGGPPTSVSVESVSSTELRISWQLPTKEYRHGHILGFNIGFRKARDETEAFNWTKIENSQESSTSAMLSTSLAGLDKFTEYEVVISAYNEQGQGPSTQPFMVLTLEDVPGAPPTDVTCSSPSSHSLSLSWQPPAKKYLNGIILSYKVVLDPMDFDGDFEYHPFGTVNGAGTELESRVNGLTTTFHGLSPFTNFSLQVGAATAVGDGMLSQSISCRTLESVPDPPAEIKAVGSSGDSFIVSWQPPRNPNGRIVKYHLYMRVLESGSGREIRTLKRTVPPSTWNYDVTELKRREAYEVWITAETQIGEGTPSASVNFVLSASGAVAASIVSFGKMLSLPWKTDAYLPCMAVGSPIIVNWKKRETKNIDPTSNPKFEIETKDNVLRIKNIQRTDNGNYTCFVRNPTGTDHIVYMLIVQVPPTAPLLHATAVTANSVRLQWKQGDNGASAIRGFILNFRPLDGEWEEITLSRKLSTYQVELLRCGQAYEFFLSALNKIGGGLPSETVKVTTKGSRPVVPNGSQIFHPSFNGMRINLDPWDGVDCPAALFIIEYKAKGSGSGSWHTIRHEVGQGRPVDNKVIQINELTPETNYVLRIRGVNGAGSSTGEYEISTSVFKGGLTSSSSKFNLSSGPSSSSSSSSSDNEDNLPFYQDMHIILPLIISIFAIVSASATVFVWLRKKRLAEGVTESTNSLSFRRDLHETGGGRGGIDYMPDRDYTVIRAKLMPDCDYIPENSEDIYPYATFHLGEKENLAENIPEGFLVGLPSSQRLSNAETISIRQIPRGPGHNHQHSTQQRKKSRSNNMSRNFGGESSAGESDEYDNDSCGSDSEAHGDLRLMNDNNTTSTINRMKLASGGGAGLYSTNTRGSTLFRNDETLLVSDRKSLPRGGRSNYSSNQPTRMSGPITAQQMVGYSTAGPTGTPDRRGIISVGQDDTSSGTATTSFIFGPPPTSHMELNQMPVDCDNRISINTSAGRNSNILGGRFMSNSQQPPPLPTLGLFGGSGGGGGGNNGNPLKLANSINNSKTSNAKTTQHNLHSDYTIAV